MNMSIAMTSFVLGFALGYILVKYIKDNMDW